jgi:hypothetical protein
MYIIAPHQLDQRILHDRALQSQESTDLVNRSKTRIDDLEQKLRNRRDRLLFLNRGHNVQPVDRERYLAAIDHVEAGAQRMAARGLFCLWRQACALSRFLRVLLPPGACLRHLGRQLSFEGRVKDALLDRGTNARRNLLSQDCHVVLHFDVEFRTAADDFRSRKTTFTR